MLKYLFSSIDGRRMTHDAQRTITPSNMRYSTSVFLSAKFQLRWIKTVGGVIRKRTCWKILFKDCNSAKIVGPQHRDNMRWPTSWSYQVSAQSDVNCMSCYPETKSLQTDGRTDRRTDRQTDRQTDGRTDAKGYNIIRPFFKRAYKTKFIL